MTYHDEIIDSHMHLWDLKNSYPWLKEAIPSLEKMIGDYRSFRQNFLIEDYLALAKKHKVTKSVHLEASGFPEDPTQESSWLQKIADKYEFPNGIVAYAKLDDPNVAEVLKKHAVYRNVCGIRMQLNWHDTDYLRLTDRADYMQDQAWQHGFYLLSEYDFVFDLQIFDHQIPEAVVLAKTFPNIQIILEHMGWPTAFSDSDFHQWQERLKKIADCPNVSVKLSGIGCVFQKRISSERIKDYIIHAVKIFTPDRCVFGSNFPLDSLFYRFDEIISFMKNALTHLTYADQKKIFYDNDCRVYRLTNLTA
jgi:predicted TIM-barrel fold metal-dependent hydrolase